MHLGLLLRLTLPPLLPILITRVVMGHRHRVPTTDRGAAGAPETGDVPWVWKNSEPHCATPAADAG
jgi:hypothetical protein